MSNNYLLLLSTKGLKCLQIDKRGSEVFFFSLMELNAPGRCSPYNDPCITEEKAKID